MAAPAFPDAGESPGPAPTRRSRATLVPGAPTSALLVTFAFVLSLLMWVWAAAGATGSRDPGQGLRATADVAPAADPFTVSTPAPGPPSPAPAPSRAAPPAGRSRPRPARPNAPRARTAMARMASAPGLVVNDTGVSGFVPLYELSGQTFAVNWLLLASIHRQETSFSSDPSTYRGLNSAGCCGGPMQFNVTNGPVSTWSRYSDSYRSAVRPAGYPHQTLDHPSIYDDFDAIMAAGRLLAASGATANLDRSAWQAAYNYYGHDAFGVTYADEVVARAIMWSQRGFCANCADDPALQAEVHAAFAPGGSGALASATPSAPNSTSAAHRSTRRTRTSHRPRRPTRGRPRSHHRATPRRSPRHAASSGGTAAH